MSVLVIDFETKDPHLKRYGTGAVLKYHYPEVEFQCLGVGLIGSDGLKEYIDLTLDYCEYTNPIEYVLDLINKYDTWVFHNASYDLGCLKYLLRDKLDTLLQTVTIHDTMLMLKEHTQQLKSYSLDSACKHFNLIDKKQSDLLHDHAWNSGLYQQWHNKKTGRNCHKRPSNNLLDNFCKTNMDLFPVEIVAKYCLQDCAATLNLHKFLIPYFSDNFGKENLQTMSDIVKICLDMKFRGVRLDLAECKRLSPLWKEAAKEAEDTVSQMLGCPGEDFNINSGPKLGALLAGDGYTIPRTDAGNYSITAPWLEEQTDEIFVHIRRYRQALKAEKDYLQKILKYQEVIPEKYRADAIGWMYPTIKPLGATATGRFSSGGGTGSYELNVLAISGHNEEFGLPLRKVFLPYEGEQIICADYSQQEPRLTVHYAHLLGCKGADEVIRAWNETPAMSYHRKVGEIAQLEYAIAKMVNLGLAYDMRAYGLSKKLKVTVQEAEKIMSQYFTLLPYIRELQNTCAYSIKKNGYVRTIDGRKLHIDEPYYFNGKLRTQERLAMSKLIQGSGAGQTMKAMIACHRAGLKLIFPIHDELVASSAQPEKDVLVMQECMEGVYKLIVPVVAEAGIGNSWLSAKP